MRLASLLTLVLVCPALAAPGSVETLRRDVQRALKLRTAGEQASALETACRGHDSADAADAIVDLVFDEELPQLALDAAVRAVGRMQDQAVVGVLRRAAETGPLAHRIRAIEALSRSEATGSGAALQPLTASQDPRVRAAALTALGRKDEKTAVPTVETSLADTDWTVRSAAIAALSRLGERRSVPPLCDALRAGEGRLVDDCAVALRNITGQRFGPDPVRYEAWWRREEKKELPPAPPYTAPPRSFASPIVGTRGRRILFVLSTAETMRDPISGAADDEETARGVAEAGADLAADLKAAKTKLDVARVHLRTMIRTLIDGVEFDVMTYSGSPVYAFGKLTLADASSKRRAESRVQGLSASGPANLHGALLRVFDPRGKDPLDGDDGPDTVILVSDGALSEPGSTDSVEVGAAAMRWNAVRQIRFLVVGAGQTDDAVLGRLAAGPPEGASTRVP